MPLSDVTFPAYIIFFYEGKHSLFKHTELSHSEDSSVSIWWQVSNRKHFRLNTSIIFLVTFCRVYAKCILLDYFSTIGLYVVYWKTNTLLWQTWCIYIVVLTSKRNFTNINRTTSSSVDSDQIVPRCRADFSLCPKNAKSFLKCENKVLSWTELMAYQTIACVKNDNKKVGKLGSLFYRFWHRTLSRLY